MRQGKLELFLSTREDALARGDRSVVTTMNAELDRLGWREPANLLDRHETVLETTQAVMPEAAVPKKARGRPPRPRCEHDMLVERCPDCSEETI